MLVNSTTKAPMYGSREEILPKDCKEHYLFLLEFFVKQAAGDRLTKLNQMFFVPTSVHFGFLDFVNEDDLEVTPVNPLFEPQEGLTNDAEIFNAGKSVMFAIDHNSVIDSTATLILEIIVKKKMPDSIKPDVLVGIGELDLSDQYAALRIEMLQCWRKGITTSKIFDCQVPFFYNEELAGNLDIFVRISGLGQSIVTEFDAPMSQDSTTFLFSAEEIDNNLMYKCHKVGSRDIELYEDPSESFVCSSQKYLCIPCDGTAIPEKDEKICEKADDTKTKKLRHMPSKGLIQTSRGPSQPCGNPVVLKVSGLFDNDKKKPTVTVGDESTATKPGSQPDPEHDIFVLRIGKKGIVNVGEKSDIELELKTPKGPERKPIRYETREMQTDFQAVKPKGAAKAKKKKKKK